MRSAAAIGVVLGDAAAVVALRPQLAPVQAALSGPRAAIAAHGADGALVPVAGALVWLAAVWLGVALAVGLSLRLPGLAGRIAGRVAGLLAGRLLPRAVLTLVSGSAGVGLLLAPVASAAPAPGPSQHLPAPAWPVTSTSAPAWPTSAPPTTPAHAPRREPRPAAAGSAAVTVRPGDSLWTIARGRLGARATPARIAREWPRWFATNRAVIGADPDLLQPGQVLRAPAPSSDPSSPEARQ